MPRLWPITLVLFLLAGCAGMEPFEPPKAGDTPPGPGLFTGEKGEIVLTPPAF
jgi:hypothetical protein